jgi:hypothetical protein
MTLSLRPGRRRKPRTGLAAGPRNLMLINVSKRKLKRAVFSYFSPERRQQLGASSHLSGLSAGPAVGRRKAQGACEALRCNLLEQFQPLASHRRLRKDETGDVTARPREVRDEAAADWVGNDRENDGDGARLLKQCAGGGCGARKKEVGL